jgi:DNA-binding SARP family transcriptional activator
MPRTAQIALMGAFEFRQEGAPVLLPTSVQRLLAFLALHPRPLRRLYVAGQLWLDASEAHASGSLRSALWRLHRRCGEVVRARGSELELAPWVQVDARRLSALAGTMAEPGRPASAEEVRELCESDDLLPDWYDPWLDAERERFRQIRLHALERLCERLIGEGRGEEALQAGLAAVHADPLRETAHRAMIRMHLAEGNATEAVRQYDTCTRLVSEALGVAPSRELRQLLEDGVAQR